VPGRRSRPSRAGCRARRGRREHSDHRMIDPSTRSFMVTLSMTGDLIPPRHPGRRREPTRTDGSPRCRAPSRSAVRCPAWRGRRELTLGSERQVERHEAAFPRGAFRRCAVRGVDG
jgi:hypothetical protein